MATVPPTSLTPDAIPSDVEYPGSDGRPVAETPVHYKNLTTIADILRRRFADDPMTYVGANMLLYYVRGEPRKRVAPDVFVAFGAPRDKQRRTYRVWEEDGKVPDLVVEFSSRSTKNEDQVKKLRIYRDRLGVREYFLFDPIAEYLDPPLQGHRLRSGKYAPIKPIARRLPSEVLGLHFEVAGEDLRLYDPTTGEWLPTAEEARLQEREGRLKEREARLTAEKRALEAEVEVERLRRELKARRGT
ncbi:MAG TPA: Uma2 family endonuclease [Pirellulales bacterium]|nr:Uma2 family endonuclease [Pirellulales bacterium]